MSRNFYCSKCGMRLSIVRKALPRYGAIVDLVVHHECAETPVEFDMTPLTENFPALNEDEHQFVKKLNDLSPKRVSATIGTDDLCDRRFDREENDKSSAPKSILGMIKGMSNSIPAHDLKESDLEREE